MVSVPNSSAFESRMAYGNLMLIYTVLLVGSESYLSSSVYSTNTLQCSKRSSALS